MMRKAFVKRGNKGRNKEKETTNKRRRKLNEIVEIVKIPGMVEVKKVDEKEYR